MVRKTIEDLFLDRSTTLDQVIDHLNRLTPSGATVSGCAVAVKNWVKKRRSLFWGGPPLEVAQEMAYATHDWIAQHCGCDKEALRASLDCFDACVRAGLPQAMAFSSLKYLVNIITQLGGQLEPVYDAVRNCRDDESKEAMLDMLAGA